MINNYSKKRNLKLFFFMIITFVFVSEVAFSQTISYSFANAKNTNGSGGVGTTHYEVDVMLTTDTDFKLGIGQFYINYNPEAFALALPAIGVPTGSLTLNHPDGVGGTYILDERVFGGATNGYQVVTNNNTQSRFSVGWIQAQSSPAISINVTVAGSPNKVAHIIMEYLDNTKDPMISFDSELGQDLLSTAGDNIGGSGGTLITDDSFDSSGASLLNTWTGATNTDWNTPSNWSLGTVPTSTSIIEIPSGAGTPVANVDINVASLTLLENASLTANLNVVSPIIVVNSGASLIANDAFPRPTITYNRNLPNTNWYLISSPVEQNVVDFVTNNSLALGSGTGINQNIALAPYNNVTSSWDYFTVGETDGLNGDDVSAVFNIGGIKGYSVKPTAPGDISFTGTLINVNKQQQISVGDGDAFNLVGNPYTNYVAVNLAAASFSTNNHYLLGRNTDPVGVNDHLSEATVWFWDGVQNQYITVNNASPARYVAPGQSFFVSAKSTGFFLFMEQMQSHQTNDVFNKSATSRPEIKLTIHNGKKSSYTDVYYINGTTLGFDNGYDSSIFGGAANDFIVYTHLLEDSQGQNLAIQSLPDSNFESMIIPIGLNAVSGSEVVFTADGINIPNGLDVIIEDREKQIFTTLSNSGAKYAVTLSENSSGIGRFYLHTNSSATLGTLNQELNNINVYSTSISNLRIVGIDTGNVSLRLNDILGKSVFHTSFKGTSVNDVSLPNLKAGIYLVDIQSEKGKLNKKIILK